MKKQLNNLDLLSFLNHKQSQKNVLFKGWFKNSSKIHSVQTANGFATPWWEKLSKFLWPTCPMTFCGRQVSNFSWPAKEGVVWRRKIYNSFISNQTYKGKKMSLSFIGNEKSRRFFWGKNIMWDRKWKFPSCFCIFKDGKC